MTATILPWAIILTKAQYNSQGVYCGLSTASEVFLIFTTQLYFSVLFLYLHCLVTSLKYSFLNTPKQQYFMQLTSGGMGSKPGKIPH